MARYTVTIDYTEDGHESDFTTDVEVEPGEGWEQRAKDAAVRELEIQYDPDEVIDVQVVGGPY